MNFIFLINLTRVYRRSFYLIQNRQTGEVTSVHTLFNHIIFIKSKDIFKGALFD